MAERPTLIVTGERLRGRHLIRLHGREFWLSSSLFQVLVRLIHARLTTLTGFAPTNDFLTPIHVHRLRRALGDDDLIQSGAYSEYRVAPAPG